MGTRTKDGNKRTTKEVPVRGKGESAGWVAGEKKPRVVAQSRNEDILESTLGNPRNFRRSIGSFAVASVMRFVVSADTAHLLSFARSVRTFPGCSSHLLCLVVAPTVS